MAFVIFGFVVILLKMIVTETRNYHSCVITLGIYIFFSQAFNEKCVKKKLILSDTAQSLVFRRVEKTPSKFITPHKKKKKKMRWM